MTTKVDVTAESKLVCTPGEQSEYCDRRARENNTNGGQRGVQVPTTLLHKVAVIFVGFTLEIPRGFEKRDGIGNKSGMASSELETTHAFGLEADSP